jgi:hypothetical protein
MLIIFGTKEGGEALGKFLATLQVGFFMGNP